MNFTRKNDLAAESTLGINFQNHRSAISISTFSQESRRVSSSRRVHSTCDILMYKLRQETGWEADVFGSSMEQHKSHCEGKGKKWSRHYRYDTSISRCDAFARIGERNLTHTREDVIILFINASTLNTPGGAFSFYGTHGVCNTLRERSIYQKVPSSSIQRGVRRCPGSPDRVWDRDVAGCQPGISQAPTFCHGRDPLNRAVANDNRATAHFTRVFM